MIAGVGIRTAASVTFIAIATVVTNMEDVGAAVAVAVKASQALA